MTDDDKKPLQSSNIPVDIIREHLKRIPAAMTEAYVRLAQRSEDTEEPGHKPKPR